MEEKRLAMWWMGGVASAGASVFTRSMDTIKVHVQTQSGHLSAYRLTMKVIERDGILALNQGLTAAISRHLSYSMFRFGFYEVSKQYISPGGRGVLFYQKVLIATLAGTIAGFIGAPFDLINIRMQNDTRLPPEKRRKYKHVIDGVARIYREEGFKRLFSGASMAMGRSILMTVGQLCFYDQTKVTLLERGLKDNLVTHFAASLLAGAAATTLTQPIDVLRTLAMNAKPGEFKSIWSVVVYTARQGPLGFFKGYVLRFARLAPHTILTFVFLEQLRLNFGLRHSTHPALEPPHR